MRTALVILTGALLVAVGAVGYLLGQGSAPDRSEYDRAYADAFEGAHLNGADRARARAVANGLEKGRATGRGDGRERGLQAGAEDGQAAAEAEVARIEEERLAAEAAAAEAAELAIPAPCRGMPDSTARRMCIGAVEAGTYP